jgi:antitoxin PrlF
MSTAKITSGGRITIPADVRQAMGIVAGDRVEIFQVECGRFEVFAATRSVRELKGMFGETMRTVSIADMNDLIADTDRSNRC